MGWDAWKEKMSGETSRLSLNFFELLQLDLEPPDGHVSGHDTSILESCVNYIGFLPDVVLGMSSQRRGST